MHQTVEAAHRVEEIIAKQHGCDRKVAFKPEKKSNYLEIGTTFKLTHGIVYTHGSHGKFLLRIALVTALRLAQLSSDGEKGGASPRLEPMTSRYQEECSKRTVYADNYHSRLMSVP
ncbi:hypothetical protein DPMN_161711 [Dreissena polymorpha]|uniref:Uncharacterized protein n=1 Tax=Dreissena polymorpha TaxID=45954 RepID=A0A9D4EQX7_DREPO|nr:hypothetical protein DPMN_161711 [Dreissena polymorpha]